MRAAIYARYSSDLQSEASIEDQVRQCGARIEQEGWTLVELYTDAAISGATILRPGYQKMLGDARSGKFEIVVAEALDRLTQLQQCDWKIFDRPTAYIGEAECMHYIFGVSRVRRCVRARWAARRCRWPGRRARPVRRQVCGW